MLRMLLKDDISLILVTNLAIKGAYFFTIGVIFSRSFLLRLCENCLIIINVDVLQKS